MLEDDRDAAIPMDRVIAYELSLRGVHGMAVGRYDALLRLVESGAVEPGRLIGRTICARRRGRRAGRHGFVRPARGNRHRAVKALALVVLVLGFLVVWQAWPVDPDLEAVCPPFGETESYTIEPVWWPPGGMHVHGRRRLDQDRRTRGAST